jgi:hypothetical protein
VIEVEEEGERRRGERWQKADSGTVTEKERWGVVDLSKVAAVKRSVSE